jgi:uncharacterized protein (TIGR03437 family)
MRGLGCLLALCTAGSSCLLAQPGFFRKDILIGERPMAVVAGDFNGDHRPDLAVATMDGVFTLLNTGGGNFGRPIRSEGIAGTDLVTGYLSSSVAVADFNGDGKDDLVGNGVLLVGRGDGTFTVSRRDLAIVVGIGDFTRDGKTDLLQADDQGSLRVLLGNGDGTFRAGATLSTPHWEPEVFAPAVADFNRDGRSDVGVLSYFLLPDSPVFRVFLGQGDGAFGPEIRTKLSCGPGCPVRAADFNGDGIPDLVSQGGIALGKGDGSFQAPIPSSSAGIPYYIAAADVTGDGRVDMVTAAGGSTVSIAPGKGDGTLLPPILESGGFYSYPGIAVDLDGDGRLDLVVVSQVSNSLSILFSRAQGGAAVRRAVSAASGIAIVAPESLATLYAPTPATTASIIGYSPNWPTSISGVSLEVRDSAGTARLAPLLYVSPTQINFQVPAGTALGEATLAIVSAGGTTQAGGMQVDAVAPGLFMIDGTTPAATGVLVEPDGTQIPIPVFTCSPSPSGINCDVSPIPLSTAGARGIYLSLFGTGIRGAKPDNVTCSVNGVQVPVVYAGPQETPGLDQINIRLRPEVLEDFFGEVMSVTIRINAVAANSAWIAVR